MKGRLAVVVTIAVLAVAAGCGREAGAERVMVPSSFASVIDEIDRAYEADGETPPEWIVAGSQRLVSQLANGARTDLLITADRSTMDRAAADGLVDSVLGVVAHNRLVLAVAPGNPGKLDHLTDLEDRSLLIGVCAEEVPCGRLAAEAAAALGIEIAADTEEPSVLSLAQKISRSELEAGLVYRTDAEDFGLETIDDPTLAPFVTAYPVASVHGKTVAVLDFLRSDEGRAILSRAGFELP